MLIPFNDPFRGTIQIDGDDEDIRAFLSRVVNNQAMRYEVEHIADQVGRLRKRLMDDCARLTPEQVAAQADDRKADDDARIDAEVQRRAKARPAAGKR